MSRYLVLWKANPSVWPTDRKAVLAVVEAATGGGSQLLNAGAIKELGWLTTDEGYAIFEADSKATVLGMLQGFSPYFSQSIQEIVPWGGRIERASGERTSGCFRLTGQINDKRCGPESVPMPL